MRQVAFIDMLRAAKAISNNQFHGIRPLGHKLMELLAELLHHVREIIGNILVLKLLKAGLGVMWRVLSVIIELNSGQILPVGSQLRAVPWPTRCSATDLCAHCSPCRRSRFFPHQRSAPCE